MAWWTTQDDNDHKVWRTASGQKVHINRLPGKNLWEVHFATGEIPAVLRQRFINWQSAIRACNEYFAQRKNPTVLVEEITPDK